MSNQTIIPIVILIHISIFISTPYIPAMAHRNKHTWKRMAMTIALYTISYPLVFLDTAIYLPIYIRIYSFNIYTISIHIFSATV